MAEGWRGRTAAEEITSLKPAAAGVWSPGSPSPRIKETLRAPPSSPESATASLRESEVVQVCLLAAVVSCTSNASSQLL